MQHRVFAYDSFVRNNESIVAVQREFRRHFDLARHDSVPTRNTILRWVESFRLRGTVMNRKPPGAPRSVRTAENVERVRQAILRSPGRSARRHSAELRLSNRSVRRILHIDLGFHPYKMAMVQQLNPRDYVQRLNFAREMEAILEQNDNIILFMSDEAHFHLNGMVNQQNCRYWASENPKLMHETPLHSPKVTVWCAVTGTDVIGPYFFQDDNGNTVTVTSERYRQMITEFFLPEVRRKRIPIRRVWFQQDGATAHTARISMEAIRPVFRGRIISRFGDINWPPRSPDLSMCDYFLWGYLKARVYQHKARTLEELKEAIRVEVVQIDRAMLERVEANFRERLEMCIAENGRHLTDVVFNH